MLFNISTLAVVLAFFTQQIAGVAVAENSLLTRETIEKSYALSGPVYIRQECVCNEDSCVGPACCDNGTC